MSALQYRLVDAVTDAAGDATIYSGRATGKILSISYVKDATTPFADGVDFTITTESSVQTVWAESNVNASKECHPRAATHSTAGVAALYAAAGQAVLDHIRMVDERIKIVIAAGGDTKSGRFIIVVGD